MLLFSFAALAETSTAPSVSTRTQGRYPAVSGRCLAAIFRSFTTHAHLIASGDFEIQVQESGCRRYSWKRPARRLYRLEETVKSRRGFFTVRRRRFPKPQLPKALKITRPHPAAVAQQQSYAPDTLQGERGGPGSLLVALRRTSLPPNTRHARNPTSKGEPKCAYKFIKPPP